MALISVSAPTIVPIPRGRGNTDVTLQIAGTCQVQYTLDPDTANATAWISKGVTNPVVDDVVHFDIGITGLKLTPTGTASYAIL